MDPTAALAELRDMIRSYQQGDPVDTARALDLWSGLDEWLGRGGFLPEQWTGPTEGDPNMHRGVAAVVTNPSDTVTELRELDAQYPAEPDRVLTLVAGLDRWITVQSSLLPDQWLTVRR